MPHRTVCEFQLGAASYADLRLPDQPAVEKVCWWFTNPSPGYEAMKNAVCFYPQKVDLTCGSPGEAVTPLQSSFYGDWPTSRIAGPTKGPRAPSSGNRSWAGARAILRLVPEAQPKRATVVLATLIAVAGWPTSTRPWPTSLCPRSAAHSTPARPR